MKVAVVHNGNKDGIINRFGQPCPEVYAQRHVNLVADSLRHGGHTVACLQADKTLLAELEKFMPAAPSGEPTGIVFNMAYGIQGECRYTHVPAMLEMAGVPYTGSSPLGHALALDKVITKILMIEAGVPTPAFKVMKEVGESDQGLTYPLVVKPRHESTSFGLQLVHNREQLDRAVASIVQQYQQEALVEDYIDGREVCIGLLGNNPMEFLPTVELDFSDRATRLMTWEDKYHKRADEPQKVCPAPLEADLTARLQRLSLLTFRACHCKDYSRVDIRIDPQGRPFVLEINSMASLGDGGSFVKAATAAGYSFAALVNRILDVTHLRYFGTLAPRDRVVTPAAVAASCSDDSALDVDPVRPAA